MQNKRKHDVLVLNKHYVADHIISWQECMKLICKNSAHSLDNENYMQYDFNSWLNFSTEVADGYEFVHTASRAIAIPELVVLTNFFKLNKNQVKYSRENVIKRDGFQCQYCGAVKNSMKELTIDHIIPLSRGGTTNYINCICACKKCNTLKSDKLLQECGMKLLKKPSSPKFIDPISNHIRQGNYCKSWKHFLEKVDDDIDFIEKVENNADKNENIVE